MTGRLPIIAAGAVLALAAFAAGFYLSRPIAGIDAPPPLDPQALQRLYQTPLPDPQGTLHTLQEWRGKPLVVNFWATWCPPCLKEMPLLSRLQEEHPEIRIVGIAADLDGNVKEFSRNNPVSYPLLLASGSAPALMAELGNPRQALPFTLALDAAGRPVASLLGSLDEASAQRLLAAIGIRR